MLNGNLKVLLYTRIAWKI